MIRIGLTRDFFNRDGNLITPGVGPGIFDDMPDVQCEMLAEFLPEVTPSQITGFDIVINWTPMWTQNTLVGNDQLLSIHRFGVGYDKIDVPALTRTGIMLCIASRSVRRPQALAIIALLLALSMRLQTKSKLIRDGKWVEGRKSYGTGLTGKVLGSIGVGNIGHEVFTLTKPFSMKHIACDPYTTKEAVIDVGVELVDMDTLLTESDFLNISCALNEKTRHLVGEKELRKMKKTAFLINTARGPIVDEAALIKALGEGWIQGAGLDVFEQEPVSPGNPLLNMDNVIVTPHSIGHTEEFFVVAWEEIKEQVQQIIRGEIPHGVINREVWDKPEFQTKLKRLRGTNK